jgi:L-cysteine S-thiosulfotransferase
MAYGRLAALGFLLGTAGFAMAAEVGRLAPFQREGDGIVSPLDGRTGDAGRGLAIVLDRAVGNCLICHHVPVEAEPFQGELGPDLAGVGLRLSAAQIRLRLVDENLLNPATMMPPYYRVDNLKRVAPVYEGKPNLTAQQIEDVVAWLSSLKQERK